MANVRLSRQQVEVLGRLASNLRVGGQAVLVAGDAQNGKLRVHGVTLEYMTQIVPEEAGNTIGVDHEVSVSRVFNLSAGNTIGIDDGTPGLAGSVYNKTAGNTIGLSQGVERSHVQLLSAENTLTLDQDAFKQETAESQLTLGQAVSVSVVRYPQVGNTLSLGQGMGTNQHMEDADNTLSLDTDALAVRAQFASAESSLSLDQEYLLAIVKSVGSTLTLGQGLSELQVHGRQIESDIGISQFAWSPSHPHASSDIGISQSVTVQKILHRSIGNTIDFELSASPGSWRLSAGNVLTGYEYVSYDAETGYWNTVYQELASTAEYTHVIGPRPIVDSASSELNLGQEVSVSVVYNRAASNTINPKSTLGFTFIQDTTFCDYAPSVGSTSDPDAPDPPAVTPPTLVYTNNNVELSYPVAAPTHTLTLRGPELGNRDRLSPHRINRETRGGTLTVFADPQWPKVKQLEFQFIGLTENEGQDLLDFIETSLGKEVKLRDWEGQEWLGVITSTEEPIVRDRDTCNLSTSLSFELTSGD